jgi:pimeloyl-ACP methyl ester carboxylesterase
VVEAIRLASGRPALAADAEHLFPVLSSQQPRDLFADPFDTAEQFRPGLIILDDGADTPQVVDTRKRLMETAEQHDVRVHVLGHAVGTDITRYAALMHHGRYAAAYLGVGLGVYGSRATRSDGVEDRNGGNGGPW